MLKEITMQADIDNLEICQQVLDEAFAMIGASLSFQMHFMLAFEEVFVNICNYAYENGGTIHLRLEISDKDLEVTLCDWGKPFDPLKKKDPDLHASIEERKIGGLGIFLAKKYLDAFDYSYQDGKNVSVLKKEIPSDKDIKSK